MMIPQMFCEHANECPNICPCPSNCECRTTMCVGSDNSILYSFMFKGDETVYNPAVGQSGRFGIAARFLEDGATVEILFDGEPTIGGLVAVIGADGTFQVSGSKAAKLWSKWKGFDDFIQSASKAVLVAHVLLS